MFGEILGIFLGEQHLEYAFLTGRLNRWSRQETVLYGDLGGRTPVERLGSLLSRIKYKRGRRICIGLPRSRYFLRDLKFRGLTEEEAENAVRLSIATHVHLPVEDICYDCRAYTTGGQTHVLLAYAKRSLIDSIVEQVELAGHKKSLFCISPLGLGNDMLLRRADAVSFPCLSVHSEDGTRIVNIHGAQGWQGCHPVKGQGTDIADEIMRIGLGIGEALPFYGFGLEEQVTIQGKPGTDPCRLPDLQALCGPEGWDHGLSAAAVGMSAFPSISFDQKPRKKPLYLRINALQLVLVGVLSLLLLFTGIRFYQLMKISRQYNRNLSAIEALERRFAPLKAKQEKLNRLKALEQDMLDFLKERPPLLEIMKELAERTPTNAWIKYFTLRNDVLKVSAEGGSAVSTMEAWRKSGLFASVKLASPVTKDRQGRERYTVELKIKHSVGDRRDGK